jgi:hypothetical protein
MGAWRSGIMLCRGVERYYSPVLGAQITRIFNRKSGRISQCGMERWSVGVMECCIRPSIGLSPFETRSVTLPTNFAPWPTRNAPLPVVFASSSIGCPCPIPVCLASVLFLSLFSYRYASQRFGSFLPATLPDTFSARALQFRAHPIPGSHITGTLPVLTTRSLHLALWLGLELKESAPVFRGIEPPRGMIQTRSLGFAMVITTEFAPFG